MSSSVQNLRSGLYSVAQSLITVTLGENPTLLNIMVAAMGYNEKNYETTLAVDPKVINKPPPSDG